MAKVNEILKSEESQLDESFMTLLRGLPLSIKVELSIIGVSLLASFIKKAIKMYKNKSGASEYKVYSFDFGSLNPEQIAAISKLLEYVVTVFKRNSEVLDSRFKLKTHRGHVYGVIINILVNGFNEKKYNDLLKNPSLSKVFDFVSSEVESGKVYDGESSNVVDEPKRINENLNEGLIQMLWPILKTAAVIYAGKIVMNKIYGMAKKSSVDEGVYTVYGWEFDPNNVSVSRLEDMFGEMRKMFFNLDRNNIIDDITVEVFKNKGKINVYFMIVTEKNSNMSGIERMIRRVSSKYDITFEEIQRGKVSG